MRYATFLFLLLIAAWGCTSHDQDSHNVKAYEQGLRTYTQWILPNSHALSPDADISELQNKRKDELTRIADLLDSQSGRRLLAVKDGKVKDDLEQAYVKWLLATIGTD